MVTKCKNGHWYDAGVYRSCPHCKRDSEKLSLTLDRVEEDDRTVSIAEIDVSLGEQLGQIVGSGGVPSGNPESDPGPGAGWGDDDKTISFGFFGVAAAVQPVTGWVVCLTGESRGKDYRLHSGKNFVGRGTSMDIALVDDKTISRDRHCSITYDPKGNAFYLAPEGGNVVSLNGEMIGEAERLRGGDRLELGETELVFIPYCEEERKWETE